MKANDFYFDGNFLSDYNMIIASVDSDNIINETMPEIVFNTKKDYNNKKQTITSTCYDGCLTCDFQIFKSPFVFEDITMSREETRDIIRWLNRREFCKFYFVPEDESETIKNCNASFNVSKIVYNGKTIGLNLAMETDSPFFYADKQIQNWNITEDKNSFTLYDQNDDCGDTFPDFEIIVKKDGDLTITNDIVGQQTIIKNCVNGEHIKICGDTHIITTDNAQHTKTLPLDFNFCFPKITNDYRQTLNRFSFNLPCEVTVSYCPMLK